MTKPWPGHGPAMAGRAMARPWPSHGRAMAGPCKGPPFTYVANRAVCVSNRVGRVLALPIVRHILGGAFWGSPLLSQSGGASHVGRGMLGSSSPGVCHKSGRASQIGFLGVPTGLRHKSGRVSHIGRGVLGPSSRQVCVGEGRVLHESGT
jgi:hypothetical protein